MLELTVECNGVQQQEAIDVVELWLVIQYEKFVVKNVKFHHHIIKFHKVPELFPHRKVRIVRTEQLWSYRCILTRLNVISHE